MAKGLLIWTLIAMLFGIALEESYAAKQPRGGGADGGVHVMDGGDGIPPPSTL